MILIMKILLHNEYKIINLWYPTYVYQFFNFPYNYKNKSAGLFSNKTPNASQNTTASSLSTELITNNKDTNKKCYYELFSFHNSSIPIMSNLKEVSNEVVLINPN